VLHGMEDFRVDDDRRFEFAHCSKASLN
jgi:hypothetical protein